MGALLISDPEIAEILKKVYQSQRRAVFPTAFRWRPIPTYKAVDAYCYLCSKDIPEPDREPHEMWHKLKEAP